ncbi:MAG: hypothetical protein ACO3QA_00910 [Phycisphaerales bacterium]|jgi:uncharacterized membrane protein YfbV (UPF0208 family)
MSDSSRTSRVVPAVLGWALSLWFACGLAVVVAAISAFPALSSRGMIVPGHEILAAADPAASGRLAAGFVMDRVFGVTDLAQWLLAPIAFGVAVFCWRRLAGRPGGRLAAIVAILVAAGLVLASIHNLSIAPAMQASLATYRELLRAGDLESALAVRNGFEATHVLADRLYGVRMLAVGLALPLALILPGLPTRPRSHMARAAEPARGTP